MSRKQFRIFSTRGHRNFHRLRSFAGLAVGALLLTCWSAIAQGQQFQNGQQIGPLGGTETLGVYPPDSYYQALLIYRDGDLDQTIDAFEISLRQTRRDINGRWLDAIPVLAMLGEVYWDAGNLEASNQAVEQAINIAIRYRGWLSGPIWNDLVRPGNRAVNPQFLWPGAASVNRLPLADKMKFQSGQQLTERKLANGGRHEQYNIKTLDVVEVMRGLALACYRRRVIQGPLLDNDTVSNQLLDSSRYPANLQAPVPRALIGSLRAAEKFSAMKDTQAMADAAANRAVTGGVHPLSDVVGLCQVYIAAGSKQPTAAVPIAITVANQAGAYQHYGLIGEALQIAVGCATEKEAPLIQKTAVTIATSLVRRSRLASLHCMIVAADAAVTSGQLDVAAGHLNQARSILARRDVVQPRLAAYGAYVTARLIAAQNASSVTSGFEAALGEPLAQMNQFQFNHRIRNRPMITMPRLFQLARVRAALLRSVAGQTSDQILSAYANEPTIDVWRRDAVDAIAAINSNREELRLARLKIAASRTAGDNVLVLQEDLLAGRFNSQLKLSGRVFQTRSLARADDIIIGPDVVAMRNKAPKHMKKLRDAVIAAPPGDLAALATNIQQLEAQAWTVALDRVEIPQTMPPRLNQKSPSGPIPSHVAMMTFFQDGQKIHVTFASAGKTTYWTINGASRLNLTIKRLLQGIGVTKIRGERLPKDAAWKEDAAKIWQAIVPDPSLLASRDLKHLIVVPDGPLWYLPFEILRPDPTSPKLLGDQLDVRYAATPGLALRSTSIPTGKNQIAISAGKFFAPRDIERNAAIVQSVHDSATGGNSISIGEKNMVPTGWLGAQAGHVLVADVIEPNLELPVQSPLAVSDAAVTGGGVQAWLKFPAKVPTSVAISGFRTPLAPGQKSRWARNVHDDRVDSMQWRSECDAQSMGRRW